MFATGLLLLIKESICKLAAVVCQYVLDVERRGFGGSGQEGASSGGGFVRSDLHKDPASGAVNGDEEITPLGFIGHLGQVFDVNMHKPRFIIFKGLATWRGDRYRLQIAQAIDAIALEAPKRQRHFKSAFDIF